MLTKRRYTYLTDILNNSVFSSFLINFVLFYFLGYYYFINRTIHIYAFSYTYILYFLIFLKQYKWLGYEFMNVPCIQSRRNANRNICNNIKYLLIILILI